MRRKTRPPRAARVGFSPEQLAEGHVLPQLLPQPLPDTQTPLLGRQAPATCLSWGPRGSLPFLPRPLIGAQGSRKIKSFDHKFIHRHTLARRGPRPHRHCSCPGSSLCPRAQAMGQGLGQGSSPVPHGHTAGTLCGLIQMKENGKRPVHNNMGSFPRQIVIKGLTQG